MAVHGDHTPEKTPRSPVDDFGQPAAPTARSTRTRQTGTTLIRWLMEGQYQNPVRIVAFNTAEGWSRDVTEDIAREIKDHADRTGEELSPGLRDFN